ncbi:MAG: PAS domain-containing protein, partial [Syntrophomonadaceae bacterium]|nr:PAS domain-containing protein [Syntrophomonadaceae bacterium]
MSQSNHVEKFLKMVDVLDELDRPELSTFLKDSVAQLAASESRYRTLIETMTEGLVCLDPLMKITQVNQALCRMLEYSEEEILGRSYLDIIDKSQVSI